MAYSFGTRAHCAIILVAGAFAVCFPACSDDSGAGTSGPPGQLPDGGGVDGGGDPPDGGPLTSIDTGTDPVFPTGDIFLSISGAEVSVRAGRAVQTAAGVYNAGGTLIRTLWRRLLIAKDETKSFTWDYKDDFGQTVADGAYTVTIIAHNVAYQWQGVIGNTSNPGASGIVSKPAYMGGGDVMVDTVGDKVHRSFRPTAQIAVAPNGGAFLAAGYNEQQNGMARIEIAKPQERTSLSKDDFQRVFALVAADNQRAYFANTGSHGEGFFDRPENFIVGIQLSDNAEVSFPSGDAWTDGLGPGNQWASVIDPVPDGVDEIRGLAVEPNGDNLYVSHKSSGIKIINKTSGLCQNTSSPYPGSCGSSFAVPDPSALALAPNGDLWVVSGGAEVRQYESPGTTHSLVRTIGGFAKAIAIGVSPSTSTLVVLDAGADVQQLKAYDTQTGALKWVHGKKGGYNAANGPVVLPTKLNFGSESVNYVAFEPAAGGEEYFWVGEHENRRALRFKLPANPPAVDPLQQADQIMFVPASYLATVDQGNATRVFSNFLEFFVDYRKPIHQSWSLVRNWDIDLPGYFHGGLQSGFRDVYTTTQGRTYAIMSVSDVPGKPLGAINEIVELTDGGIRDTDLWFPLGARFHENMSVRYAKSTADRYEVYQRDVASIDAEGNPVYAPEALVASAPLSHAGGSTNPYRANCASGAQEETFPRTSSGVIVTFDPCASPGQGYDPSSFHLGAISTGGTDYRFRASPGGAFTLQSSPEQSQILDGDGTFNLANLGQNYAGGPVMATGRHVVYNYFGEYWNNGQANQWMHWLDNGLFLGQFGMPNYPGINKFYPLVGAAGNTFSPSIINVDGNIYLYHNDESVHAGVHRWRIRNLSSIQQMVGNIGKNQSVNNPAEIASEAIQP